MNIKIILIKGTALFFRKFFQFSPFEFGKWFIWNKILVPFINNKEIQFIVDTKFSQRFTVSLCDYIQQRLFYFGVWEKNLTNYISENLSTGDIFVDVGANIGYYSLMASRLVGNNGFVHAIEASPSIYTALCNNITLNQCSNIISHNMAASDEKGTIDIYKGRKENIGQTTVRIENSSKYNFEKESSVSADTLDNIIGLENLLNARIIKVDVEGAEWQVLQGIKGLFKKFSETTEIIIEVSPESLLKQNILPQQLIQLFTNSGYNAYVIPDNNEPHMYMINNINLSIYPLHLKEINGQVDVLFTKKILN